MLSFALLAALGATLGQPGDPPDQAVPPAEQQQADVDDAAAQPPAEEPEASADSDREEQPAERQEADTDAAAAAEQQEAGSDEAGAGLDEATTPEASNVPQQDEATRRRLGNWNWWTTPHNGRTYFSGRDNGPFTVEYTTANHWREQLLVTASVQGSPSPEQWAALDEQARAWLCASDAAVFTRNGSGVIVLTLHGATGPRRHVTISDCGPG